MIEGGRQSSTFDLQSLIMDNWQTKAAQFSQNHNLHPPPSVYALDLIGELGEVDFDQAFIAALQKYEQRWQEKNISEV